jgi:glycosyltransferase involved in cell wall biosynthesis
VFVRVCVLTSSYPLHANDMSGWFVEEQCRHIAEDEGVELTILAPGHPGAPDHERLGPLDIRRLSYFFPASLQRLAYGTGVLSNLRSRPLAWLNLVPFMLVFSLETIRVGRKADLIHAHWGPMGALAVFTRPFHRRPVVVSVRGSDIMGGVSLVRRVTAWALRRADGVSANTPVAYETVVKLSANPSLCRYIPNGLMLPDMDELSAARRRRTQDDVKIVSAGRLVRERRYDVLIRAMARIRALRPTVSLTVVGDGPELRTLKHLAETLSLGDGVRFIGQVSRRDVSRFLAEADIYVSATEADNFANAVLEGAAHALPVVATRVGFPADVVLDGQTGYLVEPGDEEALSEAVLKLVDDPQGRREAGLRMRRRIEEFGLSWRECAARSVELYRVALAGKGRTI